MNVRWSAATLVLALGGPPLVAVASRYVVGNSGSIPRLLPFDLLLWAILGIVLTIVVKVERQGMDSIGCRPLHSSTFISAFVLICGINFVLNSVLMWCVKGLGAEGYEYGMTRILALPVWYRIFLAISAGTIEESLYRGYAIERLARLTGSMGTGALIAVVAFGAAHLPTWHLGPSVVFLVDGVAATLFYLWRRDLTALVIAHVIGDTIGLVVLPPGVGKLL